MSFIRRLPLKPRIALIAGVVVSLLGLGWAGWWELAGLLLQRSFDNLITVERTQGGNVSLGHLELSGFPLRIRATVTDFVFARPDGSTWRCPEMRIEAPLWHVTAVHVHLDGRQEVRLTTGLTPIQAVLSHGGDIEVALGGAGKFTEAQVSLNGLHVQGLWAAGDIARVTLSVSQPARAVTEHTETGLMVDLRAEGLDLPLAESQILGPAIESVAATARIMGRPPKLTSTALASWSRDGGTINLDTASLHWGPVALTTEGTLALDGELQPIGALTLEITGFASAIDALVAAGLVKPNQGQTVKALLVGLSPRPEGSAPPANPTLKLPLSVHERHVMVGPFRLMPMPTLTWPGSEHP